jgi:hypothetical protein
MTSHSVINTTIRTRRRGGVTWPLAVLVGTAMIVLAALAALAGAAPARAASIAGQDVPGSQIAAALRKSPLYVDPSLSSAFPAAARKALLAAISKAPTPVFILAIPLVSGSQWATSEQLAGVVQDDLGKPGIYLTLDSDYSSAINAYTWPSDPQGLDAPPYNAADAAQTADMEQDTLNPPVWQEFLRCVRLVTEGKVESAFQAALSNPGPGGHAGNASSGGGAAAGVGTVAVVAVGTGTVLVARRRRRRRRARGQVSLSVPLSTPLSVPRAVADAARIATETDLRAQAQEQLIALGELLEEPGPAGTPGSSSDDQADADLTRALDAYDAAAKVFDSASGLPDLAGVLVLTHIGRCAAAAAQARQSGRPVPPATTLCFFNPLHGEGTRPTRWRARGGHQAVDVRACDACADAVAQRRFPSVLTDASGGQDVPYYETDSVWAATGYGQTADLIKRVQRERARLGHG